jgi:CRP/FNR family transcriptional regulator
VSNGKKPQAFVSEILLQTAAFATLGPRRCAFLALEAVERVHARDQVIFSEESCAEGVFILVEGSVRLTVRQALGNSLVLRDETAPATIITAGLVDGGPNCATATATSHSVLYVLQRDCFLRLCRRNPDFTVCLLSEIGAHLRRTSAFIDLITASGIYQRLARVLLDLMKEAGGPQFDLPCSQTELAARVGTVRELISRNLRLLEANGVLRSSGKHIIVNDAAALAAAAGASNSAAHVFESHAAPPNPVCFVLERSTKPR